MKLINLDVDRLTELFDIISKCKGSVELVSQEGDRINMKSKLSQIISLTNIFVPENSIIDQLELVITDPEDFNKIFAFMYNK